MDQTQSQTLADSATTAWRQCYHPATGVYDELFSAPGVIRPHWQTFVSRLDLLGTRELSRRWEQGRRLIHDNGVTYNVYGDPRGMERPWELDAIPFLISQYEWSKLESGLVQRAQLLNLILKDIYGPQALLRAGILPPELVLANPGFLRACHGIKPSRNFLDLYSADIARSPEGSWVVIADRTQAPSGAGYVLENRIVLSRILPDVFKECQIQRLAVYFRKLREALCAMAPYNRDNPRIVLLTPGPFNETYFEHAYLARYLNYTLVEGGDLTVRDGCVYLKTLGGLHRIDVILRRVDDESCDPLELAGETGLGIPGLAQSVRSGKVAIANPLGSGVLESPAISAFLPQLCKHLLGEDLKIPSVPSHWCGRKPALQHTLTNLHRMVIKPTYPSRKTEPIFGAKLSIVERETLTLKIQAAPHLFVAQDQVPLSTVPVLTNDVIGPRNAVIRTYLVATEQSYAVMPGGLTQIPTAGDNLVFSLQRGGGSKDTWVQSAGPVSDFSLLQPSSQPLEITRGGGDLPSRVADNLFWLGRYIERAENSVRLLRAILIRLSDKSGGEVPEMPYLLGALGHQRRTSEAAAAKLDITPQKDDPRSVIAETFRPGGLHATLRVLQSASRSLRDRVSTDTWRVIMSLSDAVIWPESVRSEDIGETLARLNLILLGLASLGGLSSESMTRGQVWRFLDMGRRLERSICLASLLRSTLVDAKEEHPSLLEALLEIADSSMTYRRRYLSNLQLAPLLDLLLSDVSNPRSMAFQMEALNEHVDNLPRESGAPHLLPEQRITLAVVSDLRLVEVQELAEIDEAKHRTKLNDLLVRIDENMASLSDLITRDYLSHAKATRQLAAFRSEGI